jgi:hypothetical protein
MTHFQKWGYDVQHSAMECFLWPTLHLNIWNFINLPRLTIWHGILRGGVARRTYVIRVCNDTTVLIMDCWSRGLAYVCLIVTVIHAPPPKMKTTNLIPLVMHAGLVAWQNNIQQHIYSPNPHTYHKGLLLYVSMYYCTAPKILDFITWIHSNAV